MRVLFIGDIFGTPGMKVVLAYLAQARQEYDFVVANGENAAGGFGITRRHFQQLRNAGVDVVTLGNHGFDQPEALELAEETPRLVRPANYPPGTPGVGSVSLEARTGERVTVAQAMGRVFMDPLDDPFRALDGLLEDVPAGEAVIVDFHAEATSEKRVMTYHLAGRVSAVLGTHTHIQTADEGVQRGTASITDVGMSGVQASSIGMAFEAVHARFVHKLPRRYKPADGPGTLCGVVLDIEQGKARSIERLRWSAASTE